MAPTRQDPARDPSAATMPDPASPGGPRLPVLRSQSATPPRSRLGQRWPWVLGLGIAAAAGLGLFLQPWGNGPVPVSVEIVDLAPVTRVLAVNGRIAALQSVDVRALVGGALTDLAVAEGDTVQSGAVLARIDAAAQLTIVRQAVAGLDGALVAQARATDALARAEALGSNISRTERDTALRAVQAAAQDVARTTALVDQARVQLAHHTIRAPMTGTVLSLHVDPGQTIDPATALMTLADLDALIVETTVDEAYATQIHAGLPAVLQLAGETLSRAGRVRFVSQQVDIATGGLAVQLSFDDPVAAPVSLTVTTNIIVDQRDAAITAPRAAIQPGVGADAVHVYVVTDGIAERRPVRVIDWPAARLIVTEGLAPGDRLITQANGLSDGQPVRVDAR